MSNLPSLCTDDTADIKTNSHSFTRSFNQNVGLVKATKVRVDDIDPILVLQWLSSLIKVSKIQRSIFVDTWEGQTYQYTAEQNSYNYSYTKDAGHKLWKKLSLLLDEDITKHNCRAVVAERYQKNLPSSPDRCLTHSASILNSFVLTNDGTHLDRYEAEHDYSHALQNFCGRGQELGSLMEWMALQRLQLIGVFGLAGCGKTMLVSKALESVRKHFDQVIWRSLRDRPECNQLLCGILQCLTDRDVFSAEDETGSLVSQLIEECTKARILLVFDDWSSVFADKTLAGIYRKDTEKYGLLLRRISESLHNSCMVLTSREMPSGLVFKQRDHRPFSRTQYMFVQGLTSENGYAVLNNFGLNPSQSASFDELLQYYSGNPYALKIAVNTICSLFGGDVSYFLAQKNLIYGEIKSLFATQISRISEIEHEAMATVVRQGQEIPLPTLISHCCLPADAGSTLEALESLLNRGFLQRNNDRFQVPTILRNYWLNEWSERN